MNSNYPNGFTNGVTIRGLPLTMSYPGQVFWVDGSSTTPVRGAVVGQNGGPGTFQRPFATIDFAIGKCTASRGDIIMVKPGHTETVSAASGIAMDVAGVAVIGLGIGSLRPTIDFTETASTLTMSAANCLLHNILITSSKDSLVSAVVVSAADCVINQCEARDILGQMRLAILTTDAADRLKILNYVHDGATAAGTNSAIAIVGGSDIEITIDKMDGNFGIAGIDVNTTATSDLFVHDVKSFRTRNAADLFIIDTITASTGQIGPNINIRLQDDAANITEAVTGATFVVQDPVYVVNAPDEKGILINWTASADAA